MKLLNFGSLNIDYVYTVNHLVQPGETIHSHSREVFCGGKGLNQSIAFARAGANICHAGMVGTEGTILTDLLKENGVDCHLIEPADVSSGHTIIQVDSKGENTIILYGGANQAITEPFVDRVLSEFGAGDFIVLQNEISSLEYVIRSAYSKGMKLIFNPAPFEQSLKELPLEYIDYFLVNEVEGHQFSGETEPEKIAKKLYQEYHTAVVLTLGKEGAMYIDESGLEYHGIYQTPVVDTTGAGDTFTGYFMHHLLSGTSPKEALKIASAASAIAVSREGAANSIPRVEEVKNFLSKKEEM